VLFEICHCFCAENGEVYIGSIGGEDELGVVWKVKLCFLLA
jgi:hypothetical protein